MRDLQGSAPKYARRSTLSARNADPFPKGPNQEMLCIDINQVPLSSSPSLLPSPSPLPPSILLCVCVRISYSHSLPLTLSHYFTLLHALDHSFISSLPLLPQTLTQPPLPPPLPLSLSLSLQPVQSRTIFGEEVARMASRPYSARPASTISSPRPLDKTMIRPASARYCPRRYSKQCLGFGAKDVGFRVSGFG